VAQLSAQQETPPTLRAIVLQGAGPLSTQQLLQALNWDSLSLAYSKQSANYGSPKSRVSRDSLLVYYSGILEGRTRIDITSYQGKVVRYSINRDQWIVSGVNSYFDVTAWLAYARAALPQLEDSMHLRAGDYPPEDIVAYYHLLGVEVRNEYGWICEYSTMGIAPPQREAAVYLVHHGNAKLLRRILRGPNPEGRVYSADALIYLDRNAQNELDTLDKDLDKDGQLQKYLEEQLLSDDDKLVIEALRNSNDMVRTCGNAGSYKIYMLPVSEVLSDTEIEKIPENYQSLRDLGYFDAPYSIYY
jgi:hypothetical protein